MMVQRQNLCARHQHTTGLNVPSQSEIRNPLTANHQQAEPYAHDARPLHHRHAALAAAEHGSNDVRHAPHAKAAQHRRASAQATKQGNKRGAMLQLITAPAHRRDTAISPSNGHQAITRPAQAAQLQSAPTTGHAKATTHRLNGGKGERAHCGQTADAHHQGNGQADKPNHLTRKAIGKATWMCDRIPSQLSRDFGARLLRQVADGCKPLILLPYVSMCMWIAPRASRNRRIAAPSPDVVFDGALTWPRGYECNKTNGLAVLISLIMGNGRGIRPAGRPRWHWANPRGPMESGRVPLVPELVKTGTSQ